MPLRSSSSAANAGHSARPSRLSASSASSPKSASVTGASMPAATPDAPAPGASRSTTSTEMPACAARHAQARPTMPAPDHDEVVGASLWRSLDALATASAGITRIRFYGRRPSRRPLSRSARLPFGLIRSYPGRSARMPGVSTGSDRRERLAAARLYFVTDAGAGHLRDPSRARGRCRHAAAAGSRALGRRTAGSGGAPSHAVRRPRRAAVDQRPPRPGGARGGRRSAPRAGRHAGGRGAPARSVPTC